jgi:flagellar motor switch protein FliN
MDSSVTPKIRADLQGAVFTRVSQALESMIGAVPEVKLSEAPSPDLGAVPDTATIWQSIYSPRPDAIVAIFAAQESWNGIGQHVLQAAGIEDLDEASVKSTYTETIGQATSALWQDFSALSGAKWEMVSAGLSPTLPAEAWNFAIQVTIDSVSVVLHVFFSNGLLEALTKRDQPAEAAPREHSESSAANSAANTSPFELLFDVELPVSVSFGRALVPLKEILKLNSGSIVELNRAVTEPVEVIINNCVIARGEVVVVEGNYGVRIQQIISRQDRLRSLN